MFLWTSANSLHSQGALTYAHAGSFLGSGVAWKDTVFYRGIGRRMLLVRITFWGARSIVLVCHDVWDARTQRRVNGGPAPAATGGSRVQAH
jgi:hypothetical protein